MRYLLMQKLLDFQSRRRRHMEAKFEAHWRKQAQEWEASLTRLRDRHKSVKIAAD